MSNRSIVQLFFRRRWPDGFFCPACAHRDYYVIATRSLPLYQCKRCAKQTSVTSGTLMDKTRTPLHQWHAAIELLSAKAVNAAQLAKAIGLSHKVAWTMMRKFREAIAEAENARMLEGSVSAGVWALAPKYIWMFLPDRRYRKERVLCFHSGTDRSGHQTIKIDTVLETDLASGTKELTSEGKRRLSKKWIAQGDLRTMWMNKAQMARSSLMKRFEELRRWLHEDCNGVNTRALPSYLTEFCFRWNVATRDGSPREEWERLAFRYERNSSSASSPAS
ncbi:transposase [Paenibacillus sp. TRM 82003]|nr:transposase [Paenibacillus sp. TRM 82003]